MSAERSSSAVRNLRSIFESKESEASTQIQRSRSGSAEASREGRRPLSRVRSNFVAVELGRQMGDSSQKASPIAEHEGDDGVERTDSTAALRRQSFSANADDSEELELKKVVTHESEKRGRDQNVQETIPESAIESSPDKTPKVKPTQSPPTSAETKEPSMLSADVTEKISQPPMKRDKPLSGAEEDAGTLKPADVTEKATVTGGVALPEATALSETATPSENEAPAAPTPATKATEQIPAPATKVPLKQISTNKPRSSTDAKSKQPKTTTSTKADSTTAAVSKPASKNLNRKISRNSLAASTSSSTARGAPPDQQQALPSSPKPREPTKPLGISSHLLAPTAASRARHEVDSSANNATSKDRHRGARTSTASTTSKVAPRTSLARHSRPGSRASQTTARKPPVPAADESFLERMTRPTAASQNRAQEKFEHKSPTRRISSAAKKALPVRTNGTSHAVKDASTLST